MVGRATCLLMARRKRGGREDNEYIENQKDTA